MPYSSLWHSNKHYFCLQSNQRTLHGILGKIVYFNQCQGGYVSRLIWEWYLCLQCSLTGIWMLEIITGFCYITSVRIRLFKSTWGFKCECKCVYDNHRLRESACNGTDKCVREAQRLGGHSQWGNTSFPGAFFSSACSRSPPLLSSLQLKRRSFIICHYIVKLYKYLIVISPRKLDELPQGLCSSAI